jgi:hypothetical protein
MVPYRSLPGALATASGTGGAFRKLLAGGALITEGAAASAIFDPLGARAVREHGCGGQT